MSDTITIRGRKISVRKLMHMRRTGMAYRAIAAKLGISLTTAWKIGEGLR